jgi:hypothetical protein
MNWRWLVLGIVLTSVFALIQLPTRFIVPLLPNIPSVTLSEPTGSIWKGGLCVNSQMLPEKACINWNWRVNQVLSGNWVWDTTARSGDIQSSLVASINKTSWQINGVLAAPTGQPIPQWADWLPAGQAATEKKVDFSGSW